MGLAVSPILPPDDREPSSAWVASVMGLSLEDAEWLLVLYRFAPPQAFGEGEPGERPWRVYFCEPL
jgi:hypothetical protein